MKDIFSIPLYHENILNFNCSDELKVKDINQSVIDDCVNYYRKRLDNLEGKDTTNQTIVRTTSLHDLDGNFLNDPPGVCRAMDPVTQWKALERVITGEVTGYVNTISKYNRLKKGDEWFNYTWFNVLEKSDTYAWHDHNLYMISCVYYPSEGPGNLPIIFKSPLAGMINTWWPGPTFGRHDMNRWNQEIVIYPKKGDLIIFPSWLEHTVNTPTHGFTKASEMVDYSFGHTQTDHTVSSDDPYRVSINGNYGIKGVLDDLY